MTLIWILILIIVYIFSIVFVMTAIDLAEIKLRYTANKVIILLISPILVLISIITALAVVMAKWVDEV